MNASKTTRIAVIAAAFFALMTATARGEETGARDEQGLHFSLRPDKIQLFAGHGEVIAEGDTIAKVDLVGVATIHPISERFFARPYLAAGVVDPEKPGAEDFMNAQAGALLGYKVSPRFVVLGGGSVTALFPESGDQYRPTVNASAAFTLKKSDKGIWQLMIPISYNQAPDGEWNTTVAVVAGWTF